MDKKKYYVSVHSGEISGEISQQKGASPYQFEIEADEDEVRDLHALMTRNAEADTKTFWISHIPFLSKDQKGQSADYEDTLQSIYDRVYQLGTDTTKRQMKEMNLI
ncbi:hypothetical protein GCM10011571_30140 [Marinithermofilum abyssi]|uniref:Hydrolase n=1 Tax=Marinithermofilum abyssi TaxID=1571185 RepID=A0A8J2VEP1_9BACL|nr:hydrolase [Marinithermofilum abyssi]GGE25979.1 hypothetical protein GCM10011571_30140 [Marinithermofilum abyssi]